jgi:hypothetical protein
MDDGGFGDFECCASILCVPKNQNVILDFESSDIIDGKASNVVSCAVNFLISYTV